MTNRPFAWQTVFVKFKECLRDERGSAMTEYLLISGIMIPIAAYLFSPDTGFSLEFHTEYGFTTTVLMYPGP